MAFLRFKTYNLKSLRLISRKFSIQTDEEVELFVNGQSVKVPKGSALIQACEKAGVNIPRFCYHERLAVAGNCRMCLVEVEKSPKPVASCAFPIMPGMKVFTETPLVKKARKGVMEFLLANHPLDCPVCDQGGECDLQDQSVRYGSDRSRFFEPTGKRAVENKNFGPLIKTIMTRCIQCTRCVRFSNEVAGAPELGTSGRGNDMEIGMYVDKMLNSELSGNIIDLCPVGALTSKPYSFTSRPWELKNTESVDVMDATGSNIRVDSRGLEVMRILPRLNEGINEEWISDKTRFSYDGLKRQRLTLPLLRQNDRFEPITWPQAFDTIRDKLKNINPGEMQAIAGQLADAESMVALKDLFNRLGCENLAYEGSNGDKMPACNIDIRSNYLLNSTIENIEEADFILLIGTNPKKEAPILNARIRKSYLHRDLDIALIGEKCELTYEYEYLGTGTKAITEVANGKHPLSKKLSEYKRPAIIVGAKILEYKDSEKIFSQISKLVTKYKDTLFTEEWNGYNILHKDAAKVAALDIGFVSFTKSSKANFTYLLNADNVDPKSIQKDSFVVYQGHHGDNGAELADLILPGLAYTEKSATYINTEGRAQKTRAAVSGPGVAREDWKIIRALSEVLGKPLPYDEIEELTFRMSEVSPTLVELDQLIESSIDPKIGFFNSSGKKNINVELTNAIEDFYLTNAIARASPTMAKCSQAFVHGQQIDEPEKLAHE